MALSLLIAQLALIQSPPSGFAVLELFTSEGCSSCPAADALLGELVAESSRRDQSVIALAFHVDYWDYLGWRDPFAKAAFTARQRDYVRSLHLRSAFTPQMVVNGSHSMVGSRESEVRAAIHQALTTESDCRIILEIQDPTTLAVSLNGPFSEKAHLVYAWVSDRAERQVTAGENRGRRLQHYRVVRHIHSQPAKANQVYAIPDHLDDATRLVVLLQVGSCGPILAACEMDFSAAFQP